MSAHGMSAWVSGRWGMLGRALFTMAQVRNAEPWGVRNAQEDVCVVIVSHGCPRPVLPENDASLSSLTRNSARQDDFSTVRHASESGSILWTSRGVSGIAAGIETAEPADMAADDNEVDAKEEPASSEINK